MYGIHHHLTIKTITINDMALGPMEPYSEIIYAQYMGKIPTPRSPETSLHPGTITGQL